MWGGACSHELAQVGATPSQGGRRAGKPPLGAKLTPTMMLARGVIPLVLRAARRAPPASDKRKAPPMPWFVLGFIAMVLLNSLVAIPAVPKHLIVLGTTFLLTMALAAMGLETDFRKLKAEGAKPLLLAAAAWVFISGFALVLVKLSLYA